MKINRLLILVLFIYEIIRVIVLAILLILQENNPSIFIMVVFATQGAFFPIITLFLCLDTIRYKEYIPLFMAGKCIGVFVLLSWSLYTRQLEISGNFLNEITLISGDILALAAIIFIKKDINIQSEIHKQQNNEKTEMEENECV